MNDYAKLPPRLTRIFANNPVFFVTFCTRRRRKLLATKSVNAAFVEFGIRADAEQNVAVGRYVIMPDHLHLFVTVRTISNWEAGSECYNSISVK